MLPRRCRTLCVAGSVLVGLPLLPVQARAECSCLCLDGRFKTVCTSPDEVQANPGLCIGHAPQACPAAPQADAAKAYAPPVEGVENCRDARIYDPGAEDFVTARVCDAGAPEPTSG